MKRVNVEISKQILGVLSFCRVLFSVCLAEPVSIEVIESLRDFHKHSKLKRVALEVIAYSLSPEKIALLREDFLKIDQSQSGELTFQVLLIVLKSALFCHSVWLPVHTVKQTKCFGSSWKPRNATWIKCLSFGDSENFMEQPLSQEKIIFKGYISVYRAILKLTRIYQRKR